MSGTTLATDIMAEFSDVFKDQLGVLKRIEGNIAIDDSVVPRFHKPRPIPFALKEKVEQRMPPAFLSNLSGLSFSFVRHAQDRRPTFWHK